MEKNTLIARRIKGKGDTWEEVTGLKDEQAYISLTLVLEAYVTKTNYKGDFILSPLKGEIHIIDKEPKVLEKKKFNLYDEK